MVERDRLEREPCANHHSIVRTMIRILLRDLDASTTCTHTYILPLFISERFSCVIHIVMVVDAVETLLAQSGDSGLCRAS